MCSGSKNITIELHWIDPYSSIQETLLYQIGIAGVIFIILAIGIPLNLGIMVFEKFGDDPQKRSVLNQLVYQMNAGIIIFYTFFHNPCLLWRTMISPVSTVAFNVWWFSASTFLISFALTGVEHIILKYLSVVVFQRLLPIMDDFFARFFLLANLATSSFMGLVNCYSEEYFEIEMRASGLPTSMNRYHKFQPRVIGVCAIFTIVVGTFASIKIRTAKRKLATSANSYSVNNQRYNKDTVSIGVLFLLLALAALGLPLYYIGHQSNDSDSSKGHLVSYLLSDLGHVVIFMIVLPSLGYAGNPDLRTYITDLIRNQIEF